MRILATLALCAASGAASADVLAEIVREDRRLELHDVPGPCVNGARWAVFYHGTERVSGCWRPMPPQGAVAISWFDGSCSVFPISVFKEARPL